MRSLDSSLSRAQRHVVVCAITILTAASAALALSTHTTAENTGLLPIIAGAPHVPTQAAPADVQTPTGVRLTIADHERITKQIQAETGIEISDWVWENYSDGLTMLERATTEFEEWRRSVPRVMPLGSRPPDEPESLWESMELLALRNFDRYNALLLKVERQYWSSLALHHVSRDLLLELRQAVYRQHLLPRMNMFSGANVDVLALLDSCAIQTVDDDAADDQVTITRSYSADIMDMLLRHASAAAAERVQSGTIQDRRNARAPDAPPWSRDTIENAARMYVIEGQLAARNAACVESLRKVLSDDAGQQLLAEWRFAVYPFLWDRQLDAKLSGSDSNVEPLKSLAATVRLYQVSMHDALWKAQSHLATPEALFIAARDNAYRAPSSEYYRLRTECFKQIPKYIETIKAMELDRDTEQ